MALKSEIYLTLFIILELVGVLLLLGLLAVKSLAASDNTEEGADGWMNKPIVVEIVQGNEYESIY